MQEFWIVQSDWELSVMDVKMRKRLMMFRAFHKKGSVVSL